MTSSIRWLLALGAAAILAAQATVGPEKASVWQPPVSANLMPHFGVIDGRKGEYGSPLFAPWALTISHPSRLEPYVLRDGTLANGALALREACACLRKGMPCISHLAGTRRLKVFLADLPGVPFSHTEEMCGLPITVSGTDNGQAIAIRPSDSEVLIAGYRCSASLKTDLARWPALQQLHVERGSWTGGEWRGRPAEDLIEVGRGQLRILFGESEVVRVYW